MELELCRDRVKDTLMVKKQNNTVYYSSPSGFNIDGDDVVENQKGKRLLKR